MPALRMYQVDAFTREVFAGNPAAVCPLESWPDEQIMQGIAMENNLSETAFFAPEGDGFRLRWFTPRQEVSLCGHATLASAFVVFTELDVTRDEVRFETKSGPLWVRREGDLLAMDFPARRPAPCADPPDGLLEGLGRPPLEVWEVAPGRSLIAVYADEEEVAALRPDFARLAELKRGAAPTAPGRTSDCASRFFLPSHGIPEDPVTGSIHCSLVPYWAERLGKKQIHARQVSPRGGELFCEDRGERVRIAGYAVKYLEGVIQRLMAGHGNLRRRANHESARRDAKVCIRFQLSCFSWFSSLFSRFRLLQHRTQPAHATAHRLLLRDPEPAQLAGARDVRTAADLLRKVADAVDLDLVAVLLAEEGQCAGRGRLFERHDRHRHRQIGSDLVVDDGLDAGRAARARAARGRRSRSAAAPR